MPLPKFRRSFTGYPDSKFIEFCNGVIQGCTDNPGLPNITEPLATFQNAFDAFVKAMPARNVRNMVNTAVKNELREDANLQAVILAAFVEYDSKLNEAIMKSSNFELFERPQPKGLVGLVKGFSLATNGVNQMLIVQVEPDPNATLYNVRVSTDNENWNWFGANTARTIKIPDLPNELKLYVQVRLENSKGHSPWSESKIGVIGIPDMVHSIHD